MAVLSDQQIESYHRDGFLVVPDFVDLAACADLREAAHQIVDDFQPQANTVFTTNDQERVSNGEFLASGSNVWCFFEEEAFDERGELRQDKQLSINKIGHAQHDLDPTFQSFSYTTDLASGQGAEPHVAVGGHVVDAELLGGGTKADQLGIVGHQWEIGGGYLHAVHISAKTMSVNESHLERIIPCVESRSASPP